MRRKCLHYDGAGRDAPRNTFRHLFLPGLTGSAYERGNLLISPSSTHAAYEWWLNSYQLTVYLHKRHHYQQRRQRPQGEVTRSHTRCHTHTHSYTLSPPLPSWHTHKLPHGAVWYEKLTVIYAIMLTKYLLGHNSWDWLRHTLDPKRCCIKNRLSWGLLSLSHSHPHPLSLFN